MKEDYPGVYDRRAKTFLGMDIDFLAKSALEVSDDDGESAERGYEGFAIS
jgi:hypothetical protein